MPVFAIRVAAVIALVLGIAGCGRAPGDGVLIQFSLEDEVYRPDYLLVSWLGREPAVRDRRVPSAGTIAVSPGALPTLFIEVGDARGERALIVQGMRGESVVTMGAMRVTVSGGRQTVSLPLGPLLDDEDSDGLPDVIDDCVATSLACHTPPDAGAPDGAEPRDSGAPDLPPDADSPGTPVDAGSEARDAAAGPDAASDPRAPDAGAVDVTPPPPPPVDAMPDVVTPVNLRAGLIGYWKMDERSGTNVADSSGNGLAATLKAADPATAWVNGYKGGAVACAGKNWLRTGSVAALNSIATAFSIAAWINVPAIESFDRIILQRQVGTTTAEHFSLELSNGLLYSSGTGLGGVRSPNPVPIGRWVHVAVAFDGAYRRLYIDGAEVTFNTRRGAAIQPDDTGVTICAGQNNAVPDDPDQELNATVDEVLLYNRALTAQELQALASGTSP